jgi:DNA-binding NarL/FixJ family response regulator
MLKVVRRSATAKIASHFKLTPSELRVLYAVVEVGGGVRAIADALGVSQATVKTHLHHIFQKTGVRRQIDLVKLIAGIGSPSVE